VSDSVILKSGSEMVFNKEKNNNLTFSYSTTGAEQEKKCFLTEEK
jgi:hypothetical protein